MDEESEDVAKIWWYTVPSTRTLLPTPSFHHHPFASKHKIFILSYILHAICSETAGWNQGLPSSMVWNTKPRPNFTSSFSWQKFSSSFLLLFSFLYFFTSLWPDFFPTFLPSQKNPSVIHIPSILFTLQVPRILAGCEKLGEGHRKGFKNIVSFEKMTQFLDVCTRARAERRLVLWDLWTFLNMAAASC